MQILTKEQYNNATKMLASSDEEVRELGISIFETDELFKQAYLSERHFDVVVPSIINPGTVNIWIADTKHAYIRSMPSYDDYMLECRYVETRTI